MEYYRPAMVIEGYNYKYLNAAGTTTVKSGPGYLAGITVNGGTAGSITIADDLTGTTTIFAVADTPAVGWVLPYGVRFDVGLTIVLAAATDVTVSYL